MTSDTFRYHILQENDKWYIFQENNRTGWVDKIKTPYNTFEDAQEVVREKTGFYEFQKEWWSKYGKLFK